MEMGSYRCDQVKKKTWWIRAALNPVTDALVRRGELDTKTHRKKAHEDGDRD